MRKKRGNLSINLPCQTIFNNYTVEIKLKKKVLIKKIRVNIAMRTKMEKSFKNYCILILTNEK